MNKIKVQKNQTIADISIQECGTVEAMFDLLLKNNLTSILLIPESELFVSSVLKHEVVKYLNTRKKKIATGVVAYINPTSGSFNFSFSNAFNI